MRLFIILLISLLVFRILDIYQTAYFVSTCGMHEDNILAQMMFRNFGVLGMVVWSGVLTALFVAFVSFVYFGYSKTKYKRYAKASAFTTVLVGLLITMSVVFHWKAYGELSPDINHSAFMSEDFISTTPQPLPMSVFPVISTSNRETDEKYKMVPVVTMYGHPDNFKLFSFKNFKVRIEHVSAIAWKK